MIHNNFTYIMREKTVSHGHDSVTNALKIMFFSQTTNTSIFCIADKRNIWWKKYIFSIIYSCRFVILSGTPNSNFLYLAQGLYMIPDGNILFYLVISPNITNRSTLFPKRLSLNPSLFLEPLLYGIVIKLESVVRLMHR